MSALKSFFNSGKSASTSTRSPVARGVRHVDFETDDVPASSPSSGTGGKGGEEHTGFTQGEVLGPATVEKSESIINQISNLL